MTSEPPVDAGAMPGEETTGAPADQAQDQPISIPADLLPQGIAEGDCLRCTGVGVQGPTFTLEKGKQDDQGGDGDWEKSLREMSPRAETTGE